MAKVKLYWHGRNPLGGGASAIKEGDELKNYEDPRLEGWKEDGTVSEKQVITFSEKKNDELEAAKAENVKLKQENAALRDKQSGKKKIEALEGKVKKLEEANQVLSETVTELTADLEKATV